MKLIEVVTDQGGVDTVEAIVEQQDVTDYWRVGAPGESRMVGRLLVNDQARQRVMDALQSALSGRQDTRIIVSPVEVALPRPTETDAEVARSVSATREEIYDAVEKGARLNGTFLWLVTLSTIVAAIGLIEDNVAVVIGAMVIAPLLGPNIALALGTGLGDIPLMWQAAKANLAGLGLALSLSVLIGLLWPVNLESTELLARTQVGLDSVALALASGAAAVLSLTTGLSSVLVGVMVAVALLPPTAVMGLMLGSGQLGLAAGAALLLAVNVVSVNLAAKVVLLAKGVKPRTWLEKRKARQSTKAYLSVWAISLLLLVLVIFLRT